MVDNRSLRDKLEAMAAQSASPQEALVARLLLDRMQETETRPAAENGPASAGRIETRRIITREAVMGAPDRVSPVRTVRWRTAGGTIVEADLDDFIVAEDGHLRYVGLWP